eukprot:GHVT01032727.1.p1 GENE.GHVT01032727.1~~GHVT01032727.1.p1  ORF type:complete len:120 (-),score=8.66 GHVT01032727.1:691-1050(-)
MFLVAYRIRIYLFGGVRRTIGMLKKEVIVNVNSPRAAPDGFSQYPPIRKRGRASAYLCVCLKPRPCFSLMSLPLQESRRVRRLSAFDPVVNLGRWKLGAESRTNKNKNNEIHGIKASPL